ncbi:MAG: cellulase family glycosylhydrolase [Bacteroidota bacterium]|nr:cellulase family glycosylhydrolase [Bacteroidota bacterium]
MTSDHFENEIFLLQSRWSEDKINCWYTKNNWPIGCNYIPHNAINQLEMWQEDTFDPILINQELKWAYELGFNSIRVFLHHLVWDQNPATYLNRIEHFLAIANKYHIKTMFVLFDAVWDPFPKPGKQPDPKYYVHNSGWVQCPGFEVLNDGTKYDGLYEYVYGIVNHFKNDERVLFWDVFNEPDNNNIGSYKDDNYSTTKAQLSMNLLRKAIGWIRRIDPIQPITMAPWQFQSGDSSLLTLLDNYMFSHSDIISFHCYEDKAGIEKRIIDLKSYNRPILCTEYMARPFNSTFREILPILRKYEVGAYNWGFVAGKSQTHCPWDSWQRAYTDEPVLWFHDVLRPNGEPYDKAEVEYLIEFNRKLSA